MYMKVWSMYMKVWKSSNSMLFKVQYDVVLTTIFLVLCDSVRSNGDQTYFEGQC